MHRSCSRKPNVPTLTLLAGVLFSTTALSAQTAGVSREQMWWAPTAKDWAKPVLIEWQRTFKDAVAVSQETGRPILICVNMDGEIASEHYAGIRYRMPEIAKLYEPYVNVIASVYRHNPRDYDEKGRRIPCPRFGGVTCGEHILIEPGLFDKYFEGERVAPRHIMIELDAKETYDVYYAFDTKSVFERIRKGIVERPKDLTKAIRARAERSSVERVHSRDARDREAIEKAYVQGDRATKRRLLHSALAKDDAEQIDLLRLAIFDLDVALNKLAREALAKAKTDRATGLINEALRVPMEEKERAALIAALQRLGKNSPRARTLAVVHIGLAKDSKAVNAAAWSKALAGAKAAAPTEWSALESQLDYRAATIKNRPTDVKAHLDLAEASLALAADPKTTRILAASLKSGSKYARLMFYDARRAALKAEALGAKGWRVNSVLAIAAYYLRDNKEAHARAGVAVEAMPEGEQSWNAMAVLGVFAEARISAITRAERAKQEWPGKWLTDVHAAYSVLARHPLGTDSQVVVHYDFLRWLGAKSRAARVLDTGLERFPDSAGLHDRLRGRVLQEHGVAGLESAYAKMLAQEDASKNLPWFAGYATIVAAEFHRRHGDDDKADAAYDRAIAHYDRAIELNPDSRGSADHFAAIAIAGRARLAFEKKDYPGALTRLLASFARKSESAGSLDGLNLTPMDTGRMLLAKFKESKQDDLLAQLEAAISKLPPSTVELPAYERNTRRRGRDGRRRNRQGRRRGRRRR